MNINLFKLNVLLLCKHLHIIQFWRLLTNIIYVSVKTLTCQSRFDMWWFHLIYVYCSLFSRVMVLQGGKIVEIDSPQNLLADKSSLFYGLAKDAGLADE